MHIQKLEYCIHYLYNIHFVHVLYWPYIGGLSWMSSYDSWILLIMIWRCVLDTTLCSDKLCQWLAAGRWFSPGTRVSSINKSDHNDITEILLKVALNTITIGLTNSKRFLLPYTFVHVDYREYTCIKITYTGIHFVCLHTDIKLKIWYLELKGNVHFVIIGNVHVYYMYSY